MSANTAHPTTEHTSVVPSSATEDVPATNQELPAELSTCSAAFPADYIMDVKLDAHMGSDIPLYDRRFWKDNVIADDIATFKRQEGDHFDFEKEDYWLFCVHLHDAEMEFAIGGTNAVLATSHPNWRNVSRTTNREIVFFEKGLCFSKAEFMLKWDRYVAVRCPKMTNPAITIKANGNYGAVKWVGLFVKSTADDKNQFIAVKTTNKLLPKYAARNVNYEWYLPDGGVDVTNDRSLTLWPKQLYGTKGNSAATYDKFVTSDPTLHHRIGEVHLEKVNNKVSALRPSVKTPN
ncbi:hypothetical protein N7535_007758 [Penicillium sp. DV-2018c]|nr:hypothetical protein N7461_003792 [Penicillium sp. DV-2018c]KAJ5566120.1 hypothetical protein N7535_007758 [Penicillium sp. DV-2018c]